MAEPPNAGAMALARELYAAAWKDYCSTFYDDERLQFTIHLRRIRQELYDRYDVDLGRKFLAELPGCTEYMELVRRSDNRFTWD